MAKFNSPLDQLSDSPGQSPLPRSRRRTFRALAARGTKRFTSLATLVGYGPLFGPWPGVNRWHCASSSRAPNQSVNVSTCRHARCIRSKSTMTSRVETSQENTMLKLLVAYTTYDGHTAKIAGRIAATLRSDDCAVEVCDLARSRPD